jgi:hypothetical protein
MTNQNNISENSQSVQSHLTILQNVIQRMASNSTSSKAWCITLVSAILVVVAEKGNSHYALIAIIPTVLFFALDCYYLALEKGFRNSYNEFISKLHERELHKENLFAVKPEGKMYKLFLESVISFSIWPFYLTLLLMIYITKILVL